MLLGQKLCQKYYVFDALQGIEDIGFLEFEEEDIIRNPIITEILKKMELYINTIDIFNDFYLLIKIFFSILIKI